jgi:hypothetical protein
MDNGQMFAMMSAAQAATSISEGYAQSSEDMYNAMIASLGGAGADLQGKITQGQLTRKGGMLASQQTAALGGAGIMPTGSYAAAMLDTQTQINTDKAIAAYNTTMQENYYSEKAAALKRQAATAKRQGYEAAFSSLLRGAASYYAYSGGGGGYTVNGVAPANNAFSPTSTGYGAIRMN